MRAYRWISMAALVLPMVAQAQLIPVQVGDHPTVADQLPKQPRIIANNLAHVRSRFTFEAYPFVGRVEAPAFFAGARIPAWTTVGLGTRVDYRFTPIVSATLDVTSTLSGGPSNSQTAELGTRIHPFQAESRWYPYVDVRGAFMTSATSDFAYLSDAGFSLSPDDHYSDGYGATAGVGTLYQLSNSFFLTTGFSVLSTRMHETSLYGTNQENRYYSTTWYRFNFGISYNAVHWVGQ